MFAPDATSKRIASKTDVSFVMNASVWRTNTGRKYSTKNRALKSHFFGPPEAQGGHRWGIDFGWPWSVSVSNAAIGSHDDVALSPA
jgi:hypothetical protein